MRGMIVLSVLIAVAVTGCGGYRTDSNNPPTSTAGTAQGLTSYQCDTGGSQCAHAVDPEWFVLGTIQNNWKLIIDHTTVPNGSYTLPFNGIRVVTNPGPDTISANCIGSLSWAGGANWFVSADLNCSFGLLQGYFY